MRKLGILYSSYLTLGFCALLPLLALFNAASKNIDQQGIILICAGVCALTNLALRPKGIKWSKVPFITRVAIGVFLLAGLLSTTLNHHLSYDLWGAPYIRIGYISMLAIVSCAFFFVQFKAQQLLNWLYGTCIIIGLTAIPYNLIRLHTIDRIGGFFAQADILALFIGIGIIIGWQLIEKYKPYRPWLIFGQLILISILLLTQTRAVLGLVIVLSLLWFARILGKKQQIRQTFALIVIGVIVLAVAFITLPQRVTSPSYADTSVKYRLDLEAEALNASSNHSLIGYGFGNVADALACSHLTSKPLLQTCHQGYFFDSSHNIYLDRILDIGWIGGLAYLSFVISSLVIGFRKTSKQSTTLCFIALLIALYYLTNVTGIVAELLFWIVLVYISCRNFD